MQFEFWPDMRAGLLVEIQQRLYRRFGPPGPFLALDPVRQLALAVIGGKTRSAVSKTAFEALLSRFQTLEAVRDAPVRDIHARIKTVTFADDKAARLKAALRRLPTANGTMSLEHLRPMAVEDALRWLERLPGVGRKAAAATLNFSTLRKCALVIDTHHLRIIKRIGLVDRRANVRRAYDCVIPAVPDRWTARDIDDHHQLLKQLGQRICTHQNPSCGACPLADLCESASTFDDLAPARTQISVRELQTSCR